MTLNVIDKAQELLDAGQSQSRIAKQLGISESSIRYRLRKGSLKKMA
jgi:DNA-binding Lrp family transcriptional regulator